MKAIEAWKEGWNYGCLGCGNLYKQLPTEENENEQGD